MNEKRIWDVLLTAIGNPYGAAGLMGNLYAESALNPRNLQQAYEAVLRMTDDSYTANVDKGLYTNFVHDGAGYGLAQWTYWSRKEKLLAFARSRGASIGDLDIQLDFLIDEVKKYTAVWAALIGATSVRAASDAVLTGYERPRDMGEAVQIKRAGYGQKYYDAYATEKEGDEHMLTGKQLAEYCEKVYKTGWVYWYGTYGQKCSESLYNSKSKQYPSHYTSARAAAYKRDIAAGKTCADCVGMIKSFFWTGGQFGSVPKYGTNGCPDVSANGMINKCSETGPIKTIPNEPGLVTWKPGHIGVYIGDGYTIEMKGFDYDCKKNKVTAGPWTKWGRLPKGMITYTDEPVEPVEPAGLQKGDYGSAVKAMQDALLKWNPDCLPRYGADGDFGSETEKAVKAFQAYVELPVTGIYDEATRKALAFVLAPEMPQWVRATGDVNVRSAPGTEARVIGVLHKGETVPYQGDTREWGGRDWYLIEFEGQNGWVSSKYAEVCT